MQIETTLDPRDKNNDTAILPVDQDNMDAASTDEEGLEEDTDEEIDEDDLDPERDGDDL